jgi:hypothetical protein
MASERLLVEEAEASQIRETGPTSQREDRLEQFLQKLALPEADLVVVNVSHLSEDGGHHRREKRLSGLRPWGSEFVWSRI